MDNKAILSTRHKLNDLAIQHNKLTTLVACLLNEINSLKSELHEVKSGNSDNKQSKSSSDSHQQNRQSNPNKFPNFSELRAEDILKQLSINNPDN